MCCIVRQILVSIHYVSFKVSLGVAWAGHGPQEYCPPSGPIKIYVKGKNGLD